MKIQERLITLRDNEIINLMSDSLIKEAKRVQNLLDQNPIFAKFYRTSFSRFHAYAYDASGSYFEIITTDDFVGFQEFIKKLAQLTCNRHVVFFDAEKEISQLFSWCRAFNVSDAWVFDFKPSSVINFAKSFLANKSCEVYEESLSAIACKFNLKITNNNDLREESKVLLEILSKIAGHQELAAEKLARIERIQWQF